MDFAAAFLLQLRILTEAVDRNSGRLEQLAETIPVQADLSQQGIVPAGGLLALDLGAPPQGTYWNVRSLVVGGVTATTPAAGQAWVNVQGAPIENGIIPLITVRDQAISLPLNAFYEDRQRVLQLEYRHPGGRVVEPVIGSGRHR